MQLIVSDYFFKVKNLVRQTTASPKTQIPALKTINATVPNATHCITFAPFDFKIIASPISETPKPINSIETAPYRNHFFFKFANNLSSIILSVVVQFKHCQLFVINFQLNNISKQLWFFIQILTRKIMHIHSSH